MITSTGILTLDAFLVHGWTALLAPYRSSFAAAAAAGDGHAIFISTRQQRVPVGDERQPDVFPPLHHLLCHELFQIRVPERAQKYEYF